MKKETKMHTSLSDMTRKNAFAVPEGYFEELPTAVLLKCSVSKEKREPLRASKPVWWSVAACSLLLLGIWFVVPKSAPPSDSLLAEGEFIQTVDNLSDYLAYYVCSTVIEDELFASNIDFTPVLEELTGDEILAYLDNQNIYDLINE
jgi:hypothetical protein